MGRPINKRYFSNAVTGATASADEIKVNFHNGSAVVEGPICAFKLANGSVLAYYE